LVNSIECLLPYAVLDIKDFSQFISLKNVLLEYILLWNQFFYNMTALGYFCHSLVSNDFTNYGTRHFKLFTNCHVSWYTLYVQYSVLYVGQKDNEKQRNTQYDWNSYFYSNKNEKYTSARLLNFKACSVSLWKYLS